MDKTVKLWVKSPLLARAEQVEMESTARLKDLRRVIRNLFGGRRHIVLLHGSSELKDSDGDKTLEDLAISSGHTINVLAKLKSGQLGNLAATAASLTSTDSRSSGRSFGEVMASSVSPSSRFRPFTSTRAAPTVRSAPTPARPRDPKTAEKDEAMKEKVKKLMAENRAKSAAKRPVLAKSFSTTEIGGSGKGSESGDEDGGSVKPPVPSTSTPGYSKVGRVHEGTPIKADSTESTQRINSSSSNEYLGHYACATCDKLLSALQRYECRCGLLYCPKHRQPDAHKCPFDFKAHDRAALPRSPKPSKSNASRS